MGTTGQVNSARGFRRRVVGRGQALEQEAAARYRALSARMARQGDASMAAQFDLLADIEDRHASHVAERGQALLGHAPPPAVRAGTCRRTMTRKKRVARRSAPIRRSPSRCATKSAPSSSTHMWPPRRKTRACARWPRNWRETNWSMPRCCAIIGAAPFIPSGRSPSKFPRASTTCARWRNAGMAKLQPRMRRSRKPLMRSARPKTPRYSGASPRREKAAAGAVGAAIPKLRSAADGLRLLEEGFDRFALIGERSDNERVVAEAQRLAGEMIARLALAGGARSNTLLGVGRPLSTFGRSSRPFPANRVAERGKACCSDAARWIGSPGKFGAPASFGRRSPSLSVRPEKRESWQRISDRAHS